eukprot:13420165-Alexandrium_andersonii.AAC.1
MDGAPGRRLARVRRELERKRPVARHARCHYLAHPARRCHGGRGLRVGALRAAGCSALSQQGAALF